MNTQTLLSRVDRFPDATASGVGSRTLGPAARTVVILYATMAALALAYPQAIAAWLDDFEPNPVVAMAQEGAARLVDLSERLGLAQASGQVRDMGRQLTRKSD